MEQREQRDSDMFATISSDASTRQRVMAAVAQVRKQFQTTVSGRLAVLEQASVALEEGTLSDQLRQQAQAEAHKIAGAAGIFGVPHGSQLARSIERLLESAQTVNQLRAGQFSELVRTLRSELEQPVHEQAS